MRKHFVSVKVYEKKFCKCKSVWEKNFVSTIWKNFVSVKVYEKKFSIYYLKKNL